MKEHDALEARVVMTELADATGYQLTSCDLLDPKYDASARY